MLVELLTGGSVTPRTTARAMEALPSQATPGVHKTLKAEAVRPPAAHAAAQHRRFLHFQREYNDERPHEALGDRTPGELYRPSRRPFPEQLPPITYPEHFRVYDVSRNGGDPLQEALGEPEPVLLEEHVGLEEVDDGIWDVYFGTFLLGRFDERDRHIHGAHNRNRLPRTRR